MLFGAPPVRCAAPTTITSLATIGVACRPISPVIEIDRLIVVELQVDDAVLAEAGDRDAGLGVERDQLIARRHVDDARFRAVGPVREPAARELARRRFAALAFVLAVHPEHFAGAASSATTARRVPAVV